MADFDILKQQIDLGEIIDFLHQIPAVRAGLLFQCFFQRAPKNGAFMSLATGRNHRPNFEAPVADLPMIFSKSNIALDLRSIRDCHFRIFFLFKEKVVSIDCLCSHATKRRYFQHAVTTSCYHSGCGKEGRILIGPW